MRIQLTATFPCNFGGKRAPQNTFRDTFQRSWRTLRKLDAGYPESNEDSRIKEMFEMSLEMSNVRNFQSSTAQGGGESFKDRIAQVFR